MWRWFNGKIALGFVLGVLVAALAIDSYQIGQCGKIDSHRRAEQGQNDRAAPTKDDSTQGSEQSDYNDSHPIACGVVGFPSAIIGYMDKNEGFFVGLFTVGLFLSTTFLWRSTNKLWEAGEKQLVEFNRLTGANRSPGSPASQDYRQSNIHQRRANAIAYD
jgi:hypothetical protein